MFCLPKINRWQATMWVLKSFLKRSMVTGDVSDVTSVNNLTSVTDVVKGHTGHKPLKRLAVFQWNSNQSSEITSPVFQYSFSSQKQRWRFNNNNNNNSNSETETAVLKTFIFNAFSVTIKTDQMQKTKE